MLDHIKKTTIIVPCYNEGKRLKPEGFKFFLESFPNINLLFVNDGSHDNTLDVLNSLVNECKNASLISNERNLGKAESIRRSVLHLFEKGESDIIGYFDADMSTPIHMIPVMLDKINGTQGYKFIMGSRIKRLGAVVERKWIRHIIGRIFATLASRTLSLPVYDTQCGAKIFCISIVDKAFLEPFISRWLFDIELISRILMVREPSIIYEYPLDYWSDDGNSRIRFKDFLILPFDLMKIYHKYHKSIKNKIKYDKNRQKK